MFRRMFSTACVAAMLGAGALGCGRNDGAPPPGAPAEVPPMNVSLEMPKEPTAPKTDSTPGAGAPAADKGAK